MGTGFWRCVAVAMILAVTGCATGVPVTSAAKPELSDTHFKQRQGVIGTWLAETRLTNGATRQILTRRSPDGEFIVSFRTTHPDDRTELTEEVGYWGVSGGLYFVLTFGWVEHGKFVPARRTDGYMDDAYRIITLTDDTFEYEAIESGNRYRARRVADDYQLEVR